MCLRIYYCVFMIVVLCLVFAHSLCVEFMQRNCKLEVYVRDYYVWALNCNLWLVRIVGLLANWYDMVWYHYYTGEATSPMGYY